MAKTKNKYYNPNPLKKETGDCVVRALCKATGKDWELVYSELCQLGFELKVMPNSDECWKEYLIRTGFIYHSIKVKKGSRRPRVDEFARKKEHKDGTYVLKVANHIVTCKEGHYYDTWDSGECCLFSYGS